MLCILSFLWGVLLFCFCFFLGGVSHLILPPFFTSFSSTFILFFLTSLLFHFYDLSFLLFLSVFLSFFILKFLTSLFFSITIFLLYCFFLSFFFFCKVFNFLIFSLFRSFFFIISFSSSFQESPQYSNRS